jgi:hypothetical protein
MHAPILLALLILGCPQPVPQPEVPAAVSPVPAVVEFKSFVEHDASDWASVSRAELKRLYSDSYHPAWSGSVMLHLAPGHYILSDQDEKSRDRRKRAFHLSAYDRESRVPLLVYSPGDPAPQQHTEPADLQRIGATLFSVLDMQPPAGVTAQPLVVPISSKPKAVIVLIYDALPWSHWDRYLAKLPNHAKLRAASQEYVNTRLGHMSSSTTVSHAVLSTGQPPRLTGIPINHTRTGPGRFQEVFIGDRPGRLLVPTVADLYDVKHDNKPIIASFCSQSRAAIAMAGHGLSHPGGDADIVVWQKHHHRELQTHPEFWSMPSYLADLGPAAVMARHPDADFMGLPTTNTKQLFRSPLNIKVGEDVVTRILEKEPWGEDDLTDLLFLNQKVLDNIAHRMSADREPYRQGMDALDAYIGRFLAQLNAKFGQDYLLILTSDHGFGPGLRNPKDGPDPRRHELSDVLSATNQALGIEGAVHDAQYLNVYVDEPKLANGGKTLDDVCEAIGRLPWVYDCVTRLELRGDPGR